LAIVRGWPDDGTGTAAPEADVDALVAWGRFTDASEALAQIEQALPSLEQGPDAPALLLALYGRALLARLAGASLPDVVQACDVLERAAHERRAPVWAATAAALRARARLDSGDVGGAMTDLSRVDLEQLGAALTGRAGLLLLDTLAGAYARLRLDERVEDVRGRIESALDAALPLDRAVHWAGWATQLTARAFDDVAAGRGEPDHDLLERALVVSASIDGLPRATVPERLRRGVQGVRALAAAYRGRPSEALRLLGQDAFGEPHDLPPLERQIVTLAAIHAHALVGSIATARSLDEAAAAAPASLPHLVLDACRIRERLWLETHAGGTVVPVLGRLDEVLARIGWLGMDLMAQTARQVLEHQALRVESRTDPLTGAGNRRALDEELRHMLRFTPMPLALVLVDIDDFKQVNDAFTHVVGDEVLRRVAECLGRELRVGDHLTRYGGDEFIALLPRTGDQEARHVAQRMTDAIVALPWSELADGLTVRVSTGSAALWSLTGRRPDRDAENLFRRADEALLEAKRRRARGTAQPGWPVGGRRRRVASAEPAESAVAGTFGTGGLPRIPPPTPPRGTGVQQPAARSSNGPPTAPVTAPVPRRFNGAGPSSSDPGGPAYAGAGAGYEADTGWEAGSGYEAGTGYEVATGYGNGYGADAGNGYALPAGADAANGHGVTTGADAGSGRFAAPGGPVDDDREQRPVDAPPPPPWQSPSWGTPPWEQGPADASDDRPQDAPGPDDEELAAPPGAEPLPGARRRRATVIDLSGASTTRTPFG
jgi:diguanylate cyclase (GGDEF)-like protein